MRKACTHHICWWVDVDPYPVSLLRPFKRPLGPHVFLRVSYHIGRASRLLQNALWLRQLRFRLLECTAILDLLDERYTRALFVKGMRGGV